jgi:hypothetical protein
MVALLHAAQGQEIAVLVSDLEPQRIGPEGLAAAEVDDSQFEVAQPDDVERRLEIACR